MSDQMFALFAPLSLQTLQLGPEFLADLNIVFSAVAALVALSLLWFTALKGPSLELVSRITITPLRNPPNPASQTSPMLQLAGVGMERLATIVMEPVALIFANMGSRSGAIINVFQNLAPSETFRQYLDHATVDISVGQRDPRQSTGLPIIVARGGTAIVWLYVTLHLRSWKDVARTSQLLEMKLEDALRKIWDEGRKTLIDFSKFTGDIGYFQFSVERTRRGWVKIHLTNDKIGPPVRVEPIPEWSRERARSYLDKFGEFTPTDGEIAQRIRAIPESFINDLQKNIETLKTSISNLAPNFLQSQGLDQLTSWRTWNDPYVHVLLREKVLSRRLNDYYAEARTFQDRMLGSSLGLRKDSPEMRVLVDNMNRLLKESNELLVKMETFRTELIDSTRFLIGKEPT